LSKADHENWRNGRVDCLERVCKINLKKLSTISREIRAYAKHQNLKALWTDYRKWGKGVNIRLRFSKSGDEQIERFYATHHVGQAKIDEANPAIAVVRFRIENLRLYKSYVQYGLNFFKKYRIIDRIRIVPCNNSIKHSRIKKMKIINIFVIISLVIFYALFIGRTDPCPSSKSLMSITTTDDILNAVIGGAREGTQRHVKRGQGR
jgi:hypothetical protein